MELGVDGVEYNTTFAYANIIVKIGGRELSSFYFAYLYEDNGITKIEPEDIPSPDSTNPESVFVNIVGSSFLANHGKLKCRMQVGTETYVEIAAVYITNSTLSCEIPGSVLLRQWNLRTSGATSTQLPIEVSMNNG
mmetsp:Transcript_135/g.116  ORF Transcript_135/g.116 Transcript_135/m.116 type:complete len:136 (-) Transcript_135:7583-7990(-)